MHWCDRKMPRPAMDEPGLAHELTFSCYHGFAFLKAERTCQWLAEAVDETGSRAFGVCAVKGTGFQRVRTPPGNLVILAGSSSNGSEG